MVAGASLFTLAMYGKYFYGLNLTVTATGQTPRKVGNVLLDAQSSYLTVQVNRNPLTCALTHGLNTLLANLPGA